jgi:regulator of replication initiation timing
MTKAEFERNKLTQKVRDLEAQLSLSKQDTSDLANNYKQLVAEKNVLMQQLA